MGSDVDWTILRPPRLLDTPASGAIRFGPGIYALEKGSTISRADLANVAIDQVTSTTFIRQAVAVAD